MNYKDLQSEFSVLLNKLQQFEDRIGYDAEHVDSPNTPDERQLYQVARRVSSAISDIKWDLNYLSKDLLCEGELIKQPNNRYALGTIELRSGSPIEVYDPEDDSWNISAVEHNGSDYYIESLGRETPIGNVLARVRG